MIDNLKTEATRAIRAGEKLQDHYRRMETQSDNPRVRAVLHDLLLMEEMNEVLLRSINERLG